MATTSVKRLITGCLISAMAIVSFASPGLSKEQGSCPRFKPVEPRSDSEQTERALRAQILRVEDGAVKTDRVVTDFAVGTNIWAPVGLSNRPVVEDTKFVNLQVVSDSSRVFTLNTKLTWDSPRQLADLDLFVYDADGIEVGKSERPLGQPRSKELVSIPARGCDGFTVEVRALRTLEADGSIEMWLGSR